MEIKSLKDFKALVKACRSLGVSAMEIGEIKFNLGPLPQSGKYTPSIGKEINLEADIKVPQFNGPITEPEVPDTEMLTEEQLLMWSSQEVGGGSAQ